jgi:diacylglycerol kinase (ATP)
MKSLKRFHIVSATLFSLKGLKAAWGECAFRQEVMLSVLIIPLALCLGHGGVEKALMLGSWLMVLVVELLNSAVEAVVDRISEEHHVLSGRAKDLGSAAVFVMIVVAAVVWGCILL